MILEKNLKEISIMNKELNSKNEDLVKSVDSLSKENMRLTKVSNNFFL